MQQDRAGGGSENVKQNQDNRRVLKAPAAQGDQVPHQPQQPQKCPRCESMNTKFCYYNNYSLSQPRYFCKTCRRYWTQGGTLRNVPVGGGCRKGKRPKTSNSSSSASSVVDQVIKPNFQTTQASFSLTSSSTTASISHAVPTGMGTYFNSDHAGGFLTSLATIHSLNNQTPGVSFTLNQPLHLGGDSGGNNSSNLGLLHGFNAISSFGSSQSRQLSSYFPFEENLVRPSNRPATSQQQNWHQQGFPSSANNSSIVSDTSLWSISTTTTAVGNNNTGVGSSSSLNPDHQWPDLPGYGNPP